MVGMDNGPIEIEYGTLGVSAEGGVGIVRGILRFFGLMGDNAAEGFTAVEAGNRLLGTLLVWWQVYSIIALIASALFLYGIIYARMRIAELSKMAHQELLDEEEKYRRLHAERRPSDRFAAIDAHASSDNPNDWRLAIIEADILLEELLDQRGFRGATIGDRLKGASRDMFHSLDDAWKAHKVRNEIAHRGGDFILSKRMAADAIARYRNAFDELSAGAQGGGGGHH